MNDLEKKKKLGVYSGECLQGVLGDPTDLKLITGEPLYVGDIVITSVIDELGACTNNGLTAVVSDEFTTYSNGTIERKKEEPKYFIMGIKNVDFMGKNKEEWGITRVKSYKDVIEGENWKDYGFNYKVIEGEE